jgi:hypothetical protein
MKKMPINLGFRSPVIDVHNLLSDFREEMTFDFTDQMIMSLPEPPRYRWSLREKMGLLRMRIWWFFDL